MSIEEKRKEFAAAMKSRFEEKDAKEIAKSIEVMNYVKDQEELLEAYSEKKTPSTDILGVLRSSCRLCVKQCECYEPFEVFLLEHNESAYSNSFVPTLCRHCKCPAYYHPPLVKDFEFPNELREGLRTTVLKEDHLNFSGVLLVVDINYALIDGSQKTLKGQEAELFLLLQHGGFTVVSRSIRVMSNEEKISLGQNPSKTITTGLFMQTLIHKTMNMPELSRNTHPVLKEKQDQPLLIICISSMYPNSQTQFNKFITAAAKNIPFGMQLIYSSCNSTQGFTDVSIFFPEVFTVKRSCVLIPNENFAGTSVELDPVLTFFKLQSLRLKGLDADYGKDPNLLRIGKSIDLLHYNAYSCLAKSQVKIENFRELKEVFENFMDEARAEFLSRFMIANNSEGKVNAIGAGKVGIPLVVSLVGQSMDSFTFTAEKDIFCLFSYFLPELVMSSRTLLVFRPVAVRSGLDKLFLNIYKRNFFIVLQEEYRKLTREDLEIIGKDLKNSGNFAEFSDFMLEGECHIVAVSKLGCVEDSKVLAYGSQYGRRRTEKRLLYTRNLIIEHEAEKNPYKLLQNDEIGLEVKQAKYVKEHVQVMQNHGENALFAISPFSSISEALDLDTIIEKRLKDMQHTLDLPNLHRKQREIEKLRQFSRDFNIAMHTSDSHISAESELNHFFPHLCLFSDIIVCLRPEVLSLEKDALKLFTNMRVKVIKGCTWNNQNYYHIVKLAGRSEFEAAFSYKSPIQEILKPQHLSNLFTFCRFPFEFEETLSSISPEIKNLSLLDINNVTHDLLIEIAAFTLLVTSNEDLIGESIEFTVNYPEFLHYSFKVNTLQNTSKEIRVRKIQGLLTQENRIELLEIFDEYSVISWFYKEISQYFPKIVPCFYDFKIDPMEETLEITRVFTCSEFKGHVFLRTVAEAMKENRYREISTRKERGSMAAFMWGRKLAILTERIEVITCEHIEDFGPIYWNGSGKFLGYYSSNYFDFDYQKYNMYIDQIKSGWDYYISQETIGKIMENFREVMKSEAFRQSRSLVELGLVPEMIEFINLRVFTYKEKPDISKIHYIDANKAAMNELYGNFNSELEMKDIALTDTFPAKYHKRHMAANILWILDVYLAHHDNKAQELGMENDDYRIMLTSLIDGFVNNYSNDVGVKGISMLQLEYFLFSLTQAWKLVINLIEIQVKKESLGLGGSGIMTELAKLNRIEENITNNLAFQLEKLAKIKLEYVMRGSPADNLLINRDRYFKHYMLKEYENNMTNARYPNKIVQTKFPVLNPVLNEFIKGTLSDVQKSWFAPNVKTKINLRPVPKSAYRFDSVLVKNTKWMTHLRQQKLIKQAILYLTQSSIGGFKRATK